MLTDCHVHLDSYPVPEVGEILERARGVGVGAVVSAGTSLDSSLKCIELSSTFPTLFAGVGIHPMEVRKAIDEETYNSLKGMATENQKVVAVSETGLDFMEGAPDRAIQYQAFREQIRLAREVGLPVIFHTREANEETLLVLQEEQAYLVGAAMHYFQGDEATARRCIELGFYISLARPLLRLTHLQELAAKLPLEYVVLETDSYPQPCKGKQENWTEPRHVRGVAEKLAELQDRDVAEVEEVTTANLLRLLRARADVVREAISLPPG